MKNNKFKHAVKRDGAVVPFTDIRITNAIYRAAIASGGRDMETARKLTGKVIEHLNETLDSGQNPTVEQIQDAIEKVLIDNGHAETAKAFILFRNDRARDRKRKKELGDSSGDGNIAWQKVWESLNWSINHDTVTIAGLNKRIEEGSFPSLVNESEENYQLEIIRAADTIIKRGQEAKIVIIAGPSSSGKTTTTLKIAEYLKDEGFEFIPYHVDNYFFDLELHPVDETGDYDYETPEAIDIELLNKDLRVLLAGKEVSPPFFNFEAGKREGTSSPLKLKKGQILLIDSLHGLHGPLTEGIDKKSKVKLYIEPMLQMRGIDGSYIRWTDIR
ncbi:MAG: ATP cone domain-containing protein, partial [Elusimicrobiota bacterium]|nr:ATP cone domain-containing protein [Elusimicrobiota bacterium]